MKDKILEQVKRAPALSQAPDLNSDEINLYALIVCKGPDGHVSEREWCVSEFDPETMQCFGYMKGTENKWGRFSLNELLELEGIGYEEGFGPISFKKMKEIQQWPSGSVMFRFRDVMTIIHWD